MRDPYSAAAQGLETGFGLGLKADELAENRRRTAFQEGRQTLADQRADEDLKLRQKRESAAEDRNARLDALKGLGLVGQRLGQRRTELATAAGASLAAGGEVPQGIADEYSDVSGQAAQIDQQMRNIVSRLKSGDIGLEDIPPADRHQMILSTTGFAPEEAPRVIRAIDDFNAGMSDQNWGLVTQSMNTLLRPKLQRSWGAPSAHGGNIDHTEVIGLDPAPNNPNMVIPRLRVYTTLTDENGQNLYYDAPMTKNGTADPNDQVQAIDVQHGMDWLGNLGITMQAVQNPQVAGLFAEGAGANKDRSDRYRAELNGLALKYQPNLGVDQAWISTVRRYATENKISYKEAAQFLRENGSPRNQGVGAATIRERERIIDEDPTLTDAQRAEEKRKIALGVKPQTPEQTALTEERTRTEKARQAHLLATRLPLGTGKGTASAATAGGYITPENADLRGEDLLATLRPDVAAKVKGIASGSVDPKSFSARNNERGALETLAQMYSEGYTSKTYPTAAATEKAFATGVEGRKVRSFNVAIDHMDTLRDLAMALNNGDVRLVNELGNKIAAETGRPAPTNFAAARDLVADEIVAGVVPGIGSMQDREKAAQTIRDSQSPQQFAGVLDTYQKLLGGQLGGLKQQYRAGGGVKEFDSTFLSPRSRQVISSTGGEAASQAGGRPAAGGSKYREGQTATNPQTGQRLVFKGGQWQPVQ